MTTATSRRAAKNRYVFIGKTTTLHVHHDAFLYLSLPSLHDFDVRKCQISRFVGDVTKTKRQKIQYRYSFLEFTIKRNCQHFTNGTSWYKAR